MRGTLTRVPGRGAVTVGASVVALGLIAGLVPATAAAPAMVLPAPSLPQPPSVSNYVVREHPSSVPASGNLATGVFVIGSGPQMRSSSTTITAATSTGTPLLGDWNGDGVDSPGRYDDGTWYVTDVVVGKTPQWRAYASFPSQPGDIPVVGQMNKDRIADAGLFKDGTWTWQLSGGKTKTTAFGTTGDLPVVGDWDGDGIDDPGVFRAGTWILSIPNVARKKALKVDPSAIVEYHAESRSAVVTLAFGQATDLPVVGDWNGDGTDSPGLVQANATWYLTKSIRSVQDPWVVGFPLASGASALVGTRATGPQSCPTATPRAERKAIARAARVQAPARLTGNSKRAGQREILATVQDGLRYSITNDLTARLATRVPYAYYDVLSTAKTNEEAVRRSANVALAAAIMLTTTDWKKVQNITRDQLLAYAKWQIRSIACQHGSLTPGGWGTTWQSALWGTTAGQAGWLLWPELSKQERAYVTAMVESEADAVAARGPHYYRDRDGNELSAGNSKSDEVSWDLTAVALAQAMSPGSPRSAKWRKSLVEYSIAAFARPSDLRDKNIVNGVNVAKELPGTNANEDGTITNHNIINPDYQQNVQNLWWSASMLRVAGQPVPEAVFFNADIIYRSLAVVDYPSPPYAAPGGIVYKPGGQIYYPQGVAWGARRPATFTGVDSFAAIYSAPDTHAFEYLADHARDTRGMQLRYDTGRIYATGKTEDSYKLGKEEYALVQTALAWWAGAVPSGPGFKLDRGAVAGVNLNPRGAIA